MASITSTKQAATPNEVIAQEDRASSSAAAAAVAAEPGLSATGIGDTWELSERTWRVASIGIVLLATILRFAKLELRPLHHDEGVNSFFLLRLIREGTYQYDPANYHGPTLYYLTLPFTWLFGLETFALRFLPVLCGIGTVALVLTLRNRLGRVGSLAAAALLAVSPGSIFQSRYFIHESLFAFFTLAFVVAALRYVDTGRLRAALLAAAALALLFATKETAFISVGVIMIATALAWAYTRFALPAQQQQQKNTATQKASKRSSTQRETDQVTARADITNNVAATAKDGSNVAIDSHSLPPSPPPPQYNVPDLLGALALFVIINLVLYSSFFTYTKGISAAFQTFAFWTTTGKSDFHGKPFDAYLGWLQQEEAGLYVLGLIGALWAVLRGRNKFAIFAGLWAGGITAAYSLVRYKTPWLSLNFLIPMALASGYLIEMIYHWHSSSSSTRVVRVANKAVRLPIAVAGGVLFVALALSWAQAMQINFRHYDNNDYPYVYAHTQRSLLGLVEVIDQFARRSGKGEQTHIVITSDEYWPLPWYFRNYKPVDFYSQIVPLTPNHNFVICKDTQVDEQPKPGDADPAATIASEREFKTALSERYQQVGTYALRPGVTLQLYVQRDLAMLMR